MAEPTRLSEIEIARETLRGLASKKIPPTPDNYRSLYFEISGGLITDDFPERELKALNASLPRTSPDQNRFARRFDAAIADGSWESVGAVMTEMLVKADTDLGQWPTLIRELLQQLEAQHVGLTIAKKKEAIEYLLSGSPDMLLSRLRSLIRSWSETAAGNSHEGAPQTAIPVMVAQPGAASLIADSNSTLPNWQGGIVVLRELIAQLLDNTLTIVLRDKPELALEATEISVRVRGAQNADALVGLSDRLRKLCYRAHFIAEDQAELSTALLHLVQLIMNNVGELVVEDKWLTGQMDVVRDLILQPLDLRRLDDVERRMRDIIVKQSTLKKTLNEASERLKLLLASFVDRLADFSDTTSEYHGKIETYSGRISKADNVAELTDVLSEVMRETRIVQINVARTRDELGAMRSRVSESEQEVQRLQLELSNTSELVRHDSLTGALNRRGLDEALEKEFARVRRQGGTLTLALLDIDNFKKLNDTLGHSAGDAALVHLTAVVEEAVRPQDTLARFGGEEFVVLLPNTSVEEAVVVMTRVQRELTRKFFLNKNDKVLITFSCGVSETKEGEEPDAALKRADAAMYLAKRGGKNRVVLG